MKKTSVWTLILLLSVLAALTRLAALPAACLAAEELSVDLSLDKGPVIQAGDSLTMTLTPSGGHPPYKYRHMMSIYEHGEDHFFCFGDVPDNSHTWTVGFGESVWIKGIVWDADGKVADCETTLEVQGGVYNPLVVTGESLSPGNVIHVGDTITYTVFVEGGQPPYSYEYKLSLTQDDCWIVPEDGHSVFDTNSFSYKITRGDEGNFFSAVRDSLGRCIYTDTRVEFTILGDDHAPMDLSATHSLVKLGTNKYQLTVQASVIGGTRPVEYICRWYSSNSEGSNHDIYRNTEGLFILEGDFTRMHVNIYVIDADGWNSENQLDFFFDAKDAVIPIRTDLIKFNPLDISLREDWLTPDWRIRLGQLYDIPELVSPPIPIPIPGLINPELVNPGLVNPGLVNPELNNPGLVNPGLVNPELNNPGLVNPELNNPGLVNPGLVNPGLVNPGLTAPEVVQPEISQPGVTAPQLPPIQQPGFPNP